MDFNIRPATPLDAKGITDVNIITWQTAYKGIVPEDYLKQMFVDYEKRLLKWQKTLESASRTYVACDKENIIGFCHGGINRDLNYPYEFEIYALYVLAKYQGLGIGKKLINAFKTSDSSSEIIVWVLKDNPSKYFYEKVGGEFVAEKEIQIGGKKLIELGYSFI